MTNQKSMRRTKSSIESILQLPETVSSLSLSDCVTLNNSWAVTGPARPEWGHNVENDRIFTSWPLPTGLLNPVLSWSQFTLAFESQPRFPEFCEQVGNILEVWWQYLNHGNWQTLQVRPLPTAQSQLLNIYQYCTGWGFPLSCKKGKGFHQGGILQKPVWPHRLLLKTWTLGDKAIVVACDTSVLYFWSVHTTVSWTHCLRPHWKLVCLCARHCSRDLSNTP